MFTLKTADKMAGTEFTIRDPIDALWNIRATLYEAGQTKPLCILVPGLGSRGRHSEDNAGLVEALVAQDISVLTYDYSAMRNTERVRDPATFESCLYDTKYLMNLFRERDQVLVSKSFGINFSFAAMGENTKGVVCTIPAPDLVGDSMISYLKARGPVTTFAMKAVLNVQGFYMWDSPNMRKEKKPPVKITKEFFYSAMRPGNQLWPLIAANSNRPPVTLVPNRNDRRYINAESAPALQRQLQASGFSCNCKIADGDHHSYTQDTIDKTVAAVLEIIPPR
jgi:hypothetical protein